MVGYVNLCGPSLLTLHFVFCLSGVTTAQGTDNGFAKTKIDAAHAIRRRALTGSLSPLKSILRYGAQVTGDYAEKARDSDEN